MPPRRYPLDPLARLRAKKVDDAARELGESQRARAAAERSEATAVQVAARLEEEQRAIREGERAALARGELRVEDLMHGGAWELRAREERAQAERNVVKANADAKTARGVERTARETTAARRADAKVIERDRDAWEAGEKKRAEARDEEIADDLATARAHAERSKR